MPGGMCGMGICVPGPPNPRFRPPVNWVTADSAGGECGPPGGCQSGGGDDLPSPLVPSLNFNGTCGCLAAESPVVLADGGEKPAGEIAVGDVLLGRNPAGGPLRPQDVVALVSMAQPSLHVFHSLGDFKCSESHLVVTASGAVLPARCLEPGEDALAAADGGSAQILRVVKIGEAAVFGWTCLPDHTFLSGGLLHHNKTHVADEVIQQ